MFYVFMFYPSFLRAFVVTQSVECASVSPCLRGCIFFLVRLLAVRLRCGFGEGVAVGLSKGGGDGAGVGGGVGGR